MFKGVPFKGLLLPAQGNGKPNGRRRFNLQRWFSLVSLIVISLVALGLGTISTRYVVNESITRDALLTAQFVTAIATAELRHVDIPAVRTMGDLLDTRRPLAGTPEVTEYQRDRARWEFLDHISHLPDALLVNVYADDRRVIWSSNPDLIGKVMKDNDELEEVFSSRELVASSYHKVKQGKLEQRFRRPPEYLFIENYIPLFDAERTDVLAVVEVYKEPKDLIARIERGYQLIWLATALGGGLIYLGLYWIIRRASALLAEQQRQLVTNETFVLLGEMSSAIAHSLRNPLATIRSSAELAEEVTEEPARRNIRDIIGQVDRMSKWVRELLVSSRPLSGDAEAVDLVASLSDALAGYEQQMRANKVELAFAPVAAPAVVSQPVLLSQVLNSLLANAVEAMPGGGRLAVNVQPEERQSRVRVTITDSGRGMTPQQEAMAFKPFFTTKQGGLGVGLVMVKRIMERFGGEVGLSSREQAGTSVSLVFRVAEGGSHGT
ncbi:sensor histidine kinase [Pseudomonas citronellolis]|uniref:sensor histidine kinase n=1 Tax=Pseudomonas citronellolis TaxID=53408 RepID=UPI00226F7A00|nr:HAMP domain-containing sensor histidine kinase [Pseudomonas citronellolis]WAB90372.1 HAMP domain-containing sensor histidine kinase [Pseudomonas citronellolis]